MAIRVSCSCFTLLSEFSSNINLGGHTEARKTRYEFLILNLNTKSNHPCDRKHHALSPAWEDPLKNPGGCSSPLELLLLLGQEPLLILQPPPPLLREYKCQTMRSRLHNSDPRPSDPPQNQMHGQLLAVRPPPPHLFQGCDLVPQTDSLQLFGLYFLPLSASILSLAAPPRVMPRIHCTPTC